eukprot:CAMPEP_0174963692 /NCGR_PEP_ID=MMETSP0004_2-20121128/5468_1 /TAXON_ID=420556 /ORGANISM="Ochromonas sp., Strain CCMP1393" /LENGTH=1166 /DNA_ID=CAMNT_0016212339 /DNA_START=204 /DNA_END=3703 /DNA_ORIENTATION=+
MVDAINGVSVIASEGYAGNDCSKRTCPVGPPLADVATRTDTAHTPVECSNQGKCDYTTGNCMCNSGFQGRACQALKCYNDCSGKGECMNLKVAAKFNDGFEFNRSTTYTQWDSEVFTGCRCDPGYSGADCSQRACEYGPDPRLDVKPRESVTLVCDCLAGCSGRFKLRMFGVPLKKWHRVQHYVHEIADAIMETPGIFANNSGHVETPVVAMNDTANDMICTQGAVTRTTISFKRNHGDLPSLSFYAKELSAGNIYFETKQTLNCDCVDLACNGTFRVSFDGEMSTRLETWGKGADVLSALQSMKTIQAANITVSVLPASALVPICLPGSFSNHTLIFTADQGNVPRIGVWSSVVKDKDPGIYSTSNTTNVLRITTDDGRDDNLKLCNGIGSCDFTTGQCNCPFGWGFDADVGVCGSMQVNSSRYAGLARCPGIATITNPSQDLSGARNYQTKIYISLNPNYIVKEPQQSANATFSGIFTFAWRPDTILGPDIDESTRTLFLNLSSNTSAGPLVIDGTRDRIFYVDQHYNSPYIGVAPMQGPLGNYSVYLQVNYVIFGMTSYVYFKHRRLYWSVPGTTGGDVADGDIYYADMDTTVPVPISMKNSIGPLHVVDPHGIAIHYKQQRIYWTDKNVTANNRAGVLRSCNFDGSQVVEVFVYKQNTVSNHTVSTNLTDLIIDFVHNNTAFMLDAGEPSAVIATNLDFPEYFNRDNDSIIIDSWIGYYTTRVIAHEWIVNIGTPKYLGIDDNSFFILWSDVTNKVISFQRYIKQFLDLFSPGIVYTPLNDPRQTSLKEYYPVAMVIDKGLGPPQWDDFTECYGNGVCLGREGNFECQCDRGYFGNCQARTCPKGRAWFHEPVVNEVAHDVLMECSNMGTCDRTSGRCTCRTGFEGPACERLACQGRISSSSACSGRGRCISMRNLAKKRKNEYLQTEAVVYGSSASDPLTWDADQIFGCLADEYGYLKTKHEIYNISTATGPALSEYQCPFGYNPRLLDAWYTANASTTVLQANYTNNLEIQEIYCHADGGTFQLSFRGETSRTIYANSSAYELQQTLEEMRTVGHVNVTYESGQSVLCSITDVYRPNVTFLSELGLIPLLGVENKQVTGYPEEVTIKRVQTGSAAGLRECSGLGECDRATGHCLCNPYQGASNGIGGQGPRGDCGNNLIT